ncbi:hypothetical protein BGX27_006400 [Mortierella sp. AM989]|nr:hypothetical protein BGX27_006400 [Mortierella sp. AM989]
MSLIGYDLPTKETRAILSKLRAGTKEESSKSQIYAKDELQRFVKEEPSMRAILSKLRAGTQEESSKSQIYAKDEPQIFVKEGPSEIVCQHLDNVICALLESPQKVVCNFQALTHVFNGIMGPYELDVRSVSQLIQRHPFYQKGNDENTPLYSCKLSTTLIMLLCTEHTKDKLEITTSFLTRSSGGLDNLGKLPPNEGKLMATVESTKNDMIRDRKCRVLAISMTDLHVYRVPYQKESIAHAFVLALSIDKDDRLSGKLYQAFGPPSIGYDLTSWCLGKKPRGHLSPEMLVEFVADYEKFVKQNKWDKQSERDKSGHKPVAALFIGNIGAGKSTLLNQVGGDFPAGSSFRHGLTQDITEKWVLLNGEWILLMDVPGLFEPSEEKTKRNSKLLCDALKRGYDYKLFFVLKANNRGPEDADMIMMSKINEYIQESGGAKVSYRVIINQIMGDNDYRMYEKEVARDNFQSLFTSLAEIKGFLFNIKIDNVVLLRYNEKAVQNKEFREMIASEIQAQRAQGLKVEDIGFDSWSNEYLYLYLKAVMALASPAILAVGIAVGATAIEHAEKFSVDAEHNRQPEYIQYIIRSKVYFDRKRKDSNYGRIAVADVEYFNK